MLIDEIEVHIHTASYKPELPCEFEPERTERQRLVMWSLALIVRVSVCLSEI